MMLRRYSARPVASAVSTAACSSLFASARFCAAPAPAGTVKMAAPHTEDKIREMARLYSQMTLKEISALQRQIFKELGHTDDFYEQALLRGMGGGGGGGVVMAAPAALAAAAAPAAAAESAPAAADAAAKPAAKSKGAEKTSFDVAVTAYDAANKIKLVKELRTAVPALSIKEAKDAIDKVPGVIAKALSKEDAEKLKAVMESLGAKIELQ